MFSTRSRPIKTFAFCIIKSKDKIFLIENNNSNQPYFTFPGGPVNPGDDSQNVVLEAVRDDFGVSLVNLAYLGRLQKHIIIEGRKGYELTLIYEANPADDNFIEQCASGHINKHRVSWKRIAEFQNKMINLEPEGLLEFLLNRWEIKESY